MASPLNLPTPAPVGDEWGNALNAAVQAVNADVEAVKGANRSGAGSPEGSVAAPVGTRYIDTAVTGGAVSWVKVTGTGNTGWALEGAKAVADHVATAESQRIIDTMSIKGGMNVGGGGRLAWTSDGISWTERFISIGRGQNPGYAKGGFYDIIMPPNGTVIPGVLGAASETVAQNAVPIPVWTSLYYILPLEHMTASRPENFRMAGYGANFDIPAHWVLVATNIAEGPYIHWLNGVMTPLFTQTEAMTAHRTWVGSPEGAQSADVGTRYTDSNATNGAIEWIKASGTGNTGWKVVYGDTGWRNVIVFNSSGVVTTGAFGHADWGPRPGYAGYVQVRRVNRDVEVIINNVQIVGASAGGGSRIYIAPTGFLSGNTGGAQPLTIFRSGTPGVISFTPALNRGGSQSTASGEFFEHVSIKYPTDNPWPTTLPGTAA